MATPSSFGGGTSNPAAYLAQLGRRAKQGPVNFTGTGVGEQAQQEAQPVPPSRPVTNPFQTQQQAQAPIKPPPAQRFGQAQSRLGPLPTNAGEVKNDVNRVVNFGNENNGNLPDAPRTTGDPVQDFERAKNDGLAMRDAILGTAEDPIRAARDNGVPVPDPSDPLGLGAMFGEGGPLGMFQQLLEMLFGKGAFDQGGGGGGGGSSGPGQRAPGQGSTSPFNPTEVPGTRLGEQFGGGSSGALPSPTAGPFGGFQHGGFQPYGGAQGSLAGPLRQMPGMNPGRRLR